MLQKIKSVAVALSLIACTSVCTSAWADKLEAQKLADFSTYTLALSWQAGFCQKMADSGKAPGECKNPAPANKADFLTIHGLWPSLPASLAAKMQGKDGQDKDVQAKNKTWFRFGCSARPLTYPSFGPDQKCAAPAMQFSKAFQAELVQQMPGATDKGCLDRYEYAKHGVCFAFNHEDYFGTMMRLDKEVKGGKFGQFLASNYGKSVSREAFNEAFAANFGKESLDGLIVACNQSVKGSFLAELQLVLKRETVNDTLSGKSFGSAEGRTGNCVGNFTLGSWN
jgi:ribonuclease I